uniref:Uncharacterized protein n=1 Tax=Phocoena sinus TaxID=42100 RepID=A0A8C9CGC1_PHOSS
MSDVAADTSSEITTEDFEEEVVEEAENGRGAPARGNATNFVRRRIQCQYTKISLLPYIFYLQ